MTLFNEIDMTSDEPPGYCLFGDNQLLPACASSCQDSSQCKAALAVACPQGQNMADQSICRGLCADPASAAEWCGSAVREYCTAGTGDRMETDPLCKAWCPSTFSADRPGWCVTAATQHCNPENGAPLQTNFCSCVNRNLTSKLVGIAECFDPCASEGFHPTELPEVCPPACNVIFDCGSPCDIGTLNISCGGNSQQGLAKYFATYRGPFQNWLWLTFLVLGLMLLLFGGSIFADRVVRKSRT